MFTSSSKAKAGKKREGHQQGMVRRYPILAPSFHPRNKPRFTNRPETLQTAGLLAKVSQKPTDQSMLTGKSSRPKHGRGHTYAVQSPGPRRREPRSCSHVNLSRTKAWWAVDSMMPRLKFAGFSAGGVLAHLESDYLNMDDYDYVDVVYEESSELAYHDSLELEIGVGAVDVKDFDRESKGDVEVEDLGFYDEEIVWADQDEDEDGGWYLVVEM